VQGKISEQDHRQLPGQQQTGSQRDHWHHDGSSDRPTDGQLPGGQRTVALARVEAVAFDVHQVVDQVDGAGHQAEQNEGGYHARQRLSLGELLVEQDGGEDEAILRPLDGPHGGNQTPHRGRQRVPQGA